MVTITRVELGRLGILINMRPISSPLWDHFLLKEGELIKFLIWVAMWGVAGVCQWVWVIGVIVIVASRWMGEIVCKRKNRSDSG